MPVRGYLGYVNGGQRIHSSGGRQDFPGLGPGCHKKAKLAGRQQSCPLLPDCEHKPSHAPATSPARPQTVKSQSKPFLLEVLFVGVILVHDIIGKSVTYHPSSNGTNGPLGSGGRISIYTTYLLIIICDQNSGCLERTGKVSGQCVCTESP